VLYSFFPFRSVQFVEFSQWEHWCFQGFLVLAINEHICSGVSNIASIVILLIEHLK